MSTAEKLPANLPDLFGHTDLLSTVDKKSELNNFAPTDAPPGSSAKLEVLRQRAAAELPLFHPEDNANVPLHCDMHKVGGLNLEVIARALEAVAARRANHANRL